MTRVKGWVWGGAVPCTVGVLGACPQKRNQFCAKTYAILSKFWYLFPILQHIRTFSMQKLLPAHQRKWGILSPSPKSGGPITLSPLLRRLRLLRRRFVKITSKETPHGLPHAMVRGGICPPVKNGNVEGSKNR